MRRHLEGWPLGALSVGIALLAAALGLPRPVEPDVLPVPHVDGAEVERAAAERLDLAAETRVEPLSFEVRSLGELIRQFGRATAQGQTGAAAQYRARLPRLARSVKAAEGDRVLRALRAVQTELFLGALLRWEASGRADSELIELGGDFIAKARRSGWIHRRLLMTAEERAVLFKVRWTTLLELDHGPIGPTHNEWRLYHRFLLEHPEGGAGEPLADRADLQLRVVAALAKRDPDYPAVLAQGVLMFRRGDLAAAADAFRAYVSAAPDGAWQLRARNYLQACMPGAHQNPPTR
ncbi:MAG: hypothetical protein JW940_38235 [Polyangiaceae bacterium]|nr:hypothetical protein [Polyangiaceae bacterium]